MRSANGSRKFRTAWISSFGSAIPLGCPNLGMANRIRTRRARARLDVRLVDCAAVRVWVDMTNVAHPIVLRPLVELLEREGHQVEITARPLSHTLELLDAWGHAYVPIGRYGGASKAGKARAAVDRIRSEEHTSELQSHSDL